MTTAAPVKAKKEQVKRNNYELKKKIIEHELDGNSIEIAIQS